MKESALAIIATYGTMAGMPIALLLVLAGTYLQSAWLAVTGSALLVIMLLVFAADVLYYSAQSSKTTVVPSISGIELRGASNTPLGRGEREIRVMINRFIPGKNATAEEEYVIHADRFTTVLGAILDVKERHANSLSMRYSCNMGICGSCGVEINGKPSLACETNMFDVSVGGKVSISPMRGYPRVKDLVTDMDLFFSHHKSVEPGIYRKDNDEKYSAKTVYEQDTEARDRYLPYSECIMCGLCLDACPVSYSNPEFKGPQALSQAYRYYLDSRDQKGAARLGIVNTNDGIWECEFAGACSEVCPKVVNPSAAIQAMKAELLKEKVLGEKAAKNSSGR